MIVFDASALIALLDRHDAHHSEVRSALEDHPGETTAASGLSVAEALVHPARANELDKAVSALQMLELEVLDIPASAAPQLATLRAEHQLRMPDCCVLLAADACSATVLSTDRALRTVAARLGHTTIP